jgi:AcrR family transcriptional regulator
MAIIDTSDADGCRSMSERASGSGGGAAIDRPRRARGDVSVGDIVAAARECFAERGVAQTRMDDVAQRAGVSRPHVYAFVSSRAELLELVALERLRELGAILQERARDLDGDIGEAIVDQIIETILRGRDDPEFTALADAMPRLDINALLTSGSSPLHAITASVYGPLLARALGEGRLRADVSIDAIVEWLQGVTALLSGRHDLANDDLRTMARRFVLPGLLT